MDPELMPLPTTLFSSLDQLTVGTRSSTAIRSWICPNYPSIAFKFLPLIQDLGKISESPLRTEVAGSEMRTKIWLLSRTFKKKLI